MYAKNGYSQSSYQRYRAVKIQTASPAQIMLMLYDGAIRFSKIARKKIEEDDLSGKGTYIGKVQAIISELMGSLDFSIAPELCTQLEQLYIYMMEQLTEANVNVDVAPLDLCITLLDTLREGWGQALTSLPNDPTVGRDVGRITTTGETPPGPPDRSPTDPVPPDRSRTA